MFTLDDYLFKWNIFDMWNYAILILSTAQRDHSGRQLGHSVCLLRSEAATAVSGIFIWIFILHTHTFVAYCIRFPA